MPRVTWTIDGDETPLRRKLSRIDRLADKTGTKLSKLGSGGIGGRTGSGGLGGQRGGLSGTFGGLSGAVPVLAAGALATGALAASFGIAKLGGELETTRIQFATFLQSAEKGNDLLKELTQFANLTPFSNDEINKSAKTLLSFGFAGEEITKTLKTLGDISAGTGKPLNELSVIFGQIRSTGRLMGQDLLQLINAGFNPLQEISRTSGKSVAVLKKEMEEGLITFDDVNNAFKSATSEGGLFNNLTEKLSDSFEGKLSTALGKGRFLLQQIGEGVLPIFNKGLDSAISFLDRFASKERTRVQSLKADLNVSTSLFGALKNVNGSTQVRSNLINEINKRYSKYLPNLLTEKSSVEDVVQAQKQLTNALKEQLVTQIKIDQQKDLIAQKTDLQTKLLETELRESGIRAVLAGIDQGSIETISQAVDVGEAFGLNLLDAQDALNGNITRIIDEREGLTSDLKKVNERLARSDAALAGVFGEQGAGTGDRPAAKRDSSRTSTGSGISGGKQITNFTINIQKLVESIVFDKTTEVSEEELEDAVKRALITAVNDTQRLAGQ